MNPTFWTVFKADLVFSVCSMVFMALVTIAFAAWRKRKRKKVLEKPAPEGPQVFVFGGQTRDPAHCPLCGRDWPLPGPVKSPEVDKATTVATKETP